MVGDKFEVREYPIPETTKGTILMKQELGGICGTDLHNWEHQRLTGSIILGHENVGIIEELGTGVTTDHIGQPIKEGDRIILVPGTNKGAYGFLQSEEEPYLRGGFGEYIFLWNPDTVFLKTEMPPEVAVLTEPFTIGVHGVMRSSLQFGDTVVVQGAGAIGLVTLVCAKLCGAGRLVLVGGPAGRLELGKKLGADLTIDITDVPDAEERKQIVRDFTPRGDGADVVFECAGFLNAIPEGLDYLTHSGTYVEMGHFVDIGTFECNPNIMFMRKNLRIEAVWASRAEHFVRALPVLEKRDYPYEDMVSHVIPLDRVAEGFDALHSGYRLDGKDAIKIVVKGDA
ncbi:MAG: zinc-binding dehydrogenase [Candidatus Latescibacterota bacterium]|nr:zinc-binding dehydrogenase [Candidatus Latescibacterota bacterium]